VISVRESTTLEFDSCHYVTAKSAVPAAYRDPCEHNEQVNTEVRGYSVRLSAGLSWQRIFPGFIAIRIPIQYNKIRRDRFVMIISFESTTTTTAAGSRVAQSV
jgi:hypothetical protein